MTTTKTRGVRMILGVAVVAALGAVACSGGKKEATSGATPDTSTTDVGPEPESEPEADARVVTVKIDMIDVGYRPDELAFSVGETVKLVFHNRDVIAHEAVVGDLHTQEDHDKAMAGGGANHQAHGGMAMLTVPPGETGELRYTFGEPGEVFIGCHVPGHWAAGMNVSITVS